MSVRFWNLSDELEQFVLKVTLILWAIEIILSVYCFFWKVYKFDKIKSDQFMFYLLRLKITDLPDNVVISILKFLDLQYLLQVVNRTCKRLKSIIEDNSVLWRFFDFDSELNVKPCDIERILQHSSCFRRFLLPHRHFEVPVPDHFIESSLEKCKYLYWLD